MFHKLITSLLLGNAPSQGITFQFYDFAAEMYNIIYLPYYCPQPSIDKDRE